MDKIDPTIAFDSLEIGDTIKIFDQYDFNRGEWEAYISISNNDNMNVAKGIAKGRLLKTEDVDLLNSMKKKLYFRYTGSDVATVENEIILCKDGEVVFRSGVTIDEIQQGLQSNRFGFLESQPTNELVNHCSKFKRVYYPFVILR